MNNSEKQLVEWINKEIQNCNMWISYHTKELQRWEEDKDYTSPKDVDYHTKEKTVFVLRLFWLEGRLNELKQIIK